MLYLEDYLEMIEHLPSELRDRFTEMREMDLSVQNRVDSLEERQKTFFANCKRLRPSDREEELLKIRKEYKKVGEEASEKISIAEDCYSLVDRYLRKLDQELHKFKLELEADNRGITEVLEKRSLEMDAPAPNALKENRLPRKHNRKSHSTTTHSGSINTSMPLGPSQLADRKNSYSSLVEGMMGSSTESTSSPLSQTTFPLQHMGPGGNAIAAAASQAIQATQQLVPGRRTSSLKASYEAINLGVQAHEFSIGRELAGAAQTAIAATALGTPSSMGEASGSNPAKRQKLSKRSSTITSDSTPQQVLDVVNGASSSLVDEPLLDPSLIGSNNSPSTEELLSAGSSQDQEWNYDPSEPRYCICNQVSYGDMVACDNQDCPYEWFHYPCVAITAPPKGKWYCPTCSANMARRKGRK